MRLHECGPSNMMAMTETDWSRVRKIAEDRIEESASALNEVSQEIWAHPELGYQEHHAHKVLTNFLEKEGFEVTRNHHLETAFRATYGTDGGVHVCVICEYDALPDIGHACGHNLIAECGAAAGVGIKAALQALDGRLQGRVTVLGTPAEEGAGGKVRLIEAGAFKGMDAALMAHPYARNISKPGALSMMDLRVHYRGSAAHAAACPWEGVNALDAAVTCYAGVSAMRQQFRPEWRVHGIFTQAGAKPNIIPEEAEVLFYLRAPDNAQLAQVREKVLSCARGAALSAQCQVTCSSEIGYANMVHNAALTSCYELHAASLGLVFPSESVGEKGGSTDMGNVSHVLPSIHPKFAIPTDAATHTAGFTKWAGLPGAQLPTLLQAKAIALLGTDLLNPESGVLQRAREEFDSTAKDVAIPS